MIVLDFEKHRRNSSYYRFKNSSSSDFIRDTIVQQAIDEFEIYLQYAPNRYKIYVNNNPIPIFGTLQDVSDLELNSDSKWLLTSLKNEIFLGDILTIENRKWMCFYDKEKNTQNCFKVKIQPCNYQIKLPLIDEDGNPYIYDVDAIFASYLTDMKDYKQPFSTESGTLFMTVPYNEKTKTLRRGSRIWYVNSAYKVVGEDYTNIDHYIGHGCYKLTLRPELESNDMDNKELGVCDYYKVFPNPINEQPIESSLFILDKSYIVCGDKVKITATMPTTKKVFYTFNGDNLGCKIQTIDDKSCLLIVGRNIGIINIRAYEEGQESSSENIRIVINNS